MSDEASVSVDTTGKLRPALSATRDLPKVIEAKPEATETTQPEATAETKGASEGSETEAKPEGEAAEVPETTVETKPKRGINERFSELTQARKAAEQKADQLTTALADANATIKRLTDTMAKPEAEKPAETADPRPRRDAFDDPEAYDDALIEWSTRQATRVAKAEAEKDRLEAEQKAKKEQEEKTQKESAEALQKAWDGKRTKALEKYPDFAEVAESPEVSITIPMANTILNAENGADIAYHLGKNPEEAARIAALPPPLQVFELGKLAMQLATPKPSVSKAPDPIRPLGSKAAATAKSPEEESMEEYAARRNAQLGASRRGASGQSAKPS